MKTYNKQQLQVFQLTYKGDNRLIDIYVCTYTVNEAIKIFQEAFPGTKPSVIILGGCLT